MDPLPDRPARIRELAILVSEQAMTLEEVAQREPALVEQVRDRLRQMERIERELGELLPTQTESFLSPHAARPEPRADYEAPLPHLEGYVVESLLGTGGMGVVYLAQHLATERRVAIKTLHVATARRQTEIERFHQEYRLLARLNHPRVVQVYEVGQCAGQPFFAMEYLAGGTLEQQLTDQPLPARRAAELVAKLADTISAAHNQQIIHRDLKPANVLLTEDGEPKISDFGLARLLEDGPALTVSGTGMGTPHYMAPEQVFGRRDDLSQAVDIYALGAILYRLITGRVPHTGDSTGEIIRQLLAADPVSPARLNSRIDRDLETICLKCLEKDPKHRFASAAVLQDRLRMYLAGDPIPERPIATLARIWRLSRRNPRLASAVAASVLLLCALVVVSTVFGWVQANISGRLKTALHESRIEQALARRDLAHQVFQIGEVAHGLELLRQALQLAPPEETALCSSLALDQRLWESRQHVLQRTLTHPARILALAVSPDGQSCATCCADGRLRVWSLEQGALQLDLPSSARHLLYLPDTQCLVMPLDGQLVVLDSSTGQSEAYSVSEGSTTAISLVGDDSLAVACGQSIQFWQWSPPADQSRSKTSGLAQLKRISSLPVNASVTCMSGDSAGEYLALGCEEKVAGESQFQAQLFEIGDLRESTSLKLVMHQEIRKPIRSVAFTSDDEVLIWGDENWEARFWDVEKRKQIAATDGCNGQVVSIDSLACPAKQSTSELVLLAAHDSHHGVMWNVTKLREHASEVADGLFIFTQGLASMALPIASHTDPVTHVAWLPNGNRFLTACDDGAVRIWQRAGDAIIKVDAAPSSQRKIMRSVAINADGSRVVAAGQDGWIHCWTKEGTLVKSIDVGADVRSLGFLPDGRLISATVHGRINIWTDFTDFDSKPTASTSVDLQLGLTMFSLGADRQRLFVGVDGAARMFSLPELQPVGPVFKHSDDPTISVTTAISPNNQRLLTGGQDRQVCLWRSDGTLVSKWTNDHEIRSCTFSPDSRWAAYAGDDFIVHIVHADDGREYAELRESSPIFAIMFVDSHRLLCAHSLGAQWWDFNMQRTLGPVMSTEHEVFSIAQEANLGVLGDSRGNVMLVPSASLPE